MEVQINLDAPFMYAAGGKVPAFGYKGDLVVTTDPGKRNMAMVVGTVFGTRLAILQFRAPGRDNSNSAYCHDFKCFLREYLKGCRVHAFVIEEAISKKGMNHHYSSMVLTEIRANLIDLSFELTGKEAIQVNNWSWKFAILPDGYRSQSEKGSARYFRDIYAQYGNADVTDSIAIFCYAVQKFCPPQFAIVPDALAPEVPVAQFNYRLFPAGFPIPRDARRFHYEQGLTLQQNLAYFINRTWERGVATVPVESLTMEDIYEHAVGFTPTNAGKTLEVVCLRSPTSTAS